MQHLASVYSRAMHGLKAVLVKVEVYVSPGRPQLFIVGLPEKVVRESKHRVFAGIKYSRFKFPLGRVTINLAPADLPKEGGRFDLPIALGILAATGQVPGRSLADYEFIAELSLDGSLSSVRGVLPSALAVAETRRSLIMPQANAAEAALATQSTSYAANTLVEVCSHLVGSKLLAPIKPLRPSRLESNGALDLADVRGQHQAVRALEISAAGRHNCLLVGAPGSGKSMLAARLPGIMPPMSDEEASQVMVIRSLFGDRINPALYYRRPFCSPHHSASSVSLSGGGSDLRPGEITRSHNGVLFLDELPEFSRQTLDMLREPMEDRKISLSRAIGCMEYPANFQLIAAMNPCPDGSDVDERGRCPCSDTQLSRYYSRLSAPLLDRIDLHVRVPRLKWSAYESLQPAECSKVIRKRVLTAYQRQLDRQGACNALMSLQDIKSYCQLESKIQHLLAESVDRFNLSARAVNRALKVARTIADIRGAEAVGRDDMLEAIGYRSMDKLFVAP